MIRDILKRRRLSRELPLAGALGAFLCLLAPLSAAGAGFTVSGGTVTLADQAELRTAGSIVLTSGELSAGAAQIVVGSSWTRTGGNFTAGTSTVTFNGAAGSTQTLAGSTLFYNFKCVTPGLGLNFPTGSTQTVSNLLTLTGASGLPVTLRSSSSGDPWFLASQGAESVSFVNVKDSDAGTGNLIQTGSDSTDAGNNVNWDFGPPAAITDFAGQSGAPVGSIDLIWTAPGDDGNSGTLNNSFFTVQYTSDTVWAEGNNWTPTEPVPDWVYTLNIATDGVSPGNQQTYGLASLIEGTSYYIRAWTKDDAANYSPLSNGATAQAQVTTLSLSIAPTTYAFGAQAVGTSTNTATTLVITNLSNVTADFNLKATTGTAGSPWKVWDSVAGAPGHDKLLLRALFHPTRPDLGDFGNEDLATQSSQISQDVSGGGRYTLDDGETGLAVPVNGQRNLWLKLDMPTTTSTVAPQTLNITIEGSASP